MLALFSATKLAANGRGDHELGRGGIRFTIGIVVRHASEVDRLADRFRAAGGRITKEPTDAEFFPGRSAYVADTEDKLLRGCMGRTRQRHRRSGVPSSTARTAGDLGPPFGARRPQGRAAAG
ncbi:hypothetical protein ACIA5D_45445 [Actinoplanes sp. NPDC051513]|uniref:hypothetical protein n=1 Tax=Actinoplanes sp. NPDC051513 TaxID=3363908 RepID=UPI00378C1833